MASPSRLVAVASHPVQVGYRRLLLLVASTISLCGCWNSTPEPKPADAPYMASGGVPEAGNAITSNRALQRLANASESTDAPLGDARAAAAADDEAKGFDQNNTAAIENQAISQPAANASQVAAPRVSELSPEQLVQLLGLTDRDMQDIWSRLSQIQGGREELIRIAKMKLDAARRLKNHAEADARSKSAGARGELQALSHLAAFSDLKSAQELEDLATANLQSSDPDLVADSRLVLIGFALESLQNGEAGAADRIIGYVDQIAASGRANDVPTLMVMGQAQRADRIWTRGSRQSCSRHNH